MKQKNQQEITETNFEKSYKKGSNEVLGIQTKQEFPDDDEVLRIRVRNSVKVLNISRKFMKFGNFRNLFVENNFGYDH